MKYKIQLPRRRSASMLLGGTVAVISAAPGFAQNTTAETIESLPSIDVQATIPDEIRYTPGAASILTAEEIDTFRPYTLHDALDFIPGVRTIDDDVYGRRSGIAVRGAPGRRSRKTLLLEDGVPINASTYLDPGAHYTPPMERLERVDVLKGAGHILHGPLNNHGIINFRNKQPTLEPETTLEVGVGNLNANKRHAMHTRTEGDVGMVFAYTGMNADGSFDVEEFQYDDFFTSFDWQVNSRHELGASFTYFRERSDYDESNLLPAEYARSPRTKLGRFGQEFNNISVNYFKVDLVHDFQVNDKLSMQTRGFFTDLDRPRFTVEPDEVPFQADGTPDFTALGANQFIPGQSGVMIGRDRQYNTMGVENRMELANINFGSNVDHTFQWGLRYERHFLDEQEPAGRIGEVLDESNRGSIFEINAIDSGQQTKFQSTAVSGFIQDAIRFDDWTITPGVRVEHYTQNRNPVVIDGQPNRGDKQETDHTLLLPSISFLYEGFDNTQVFANVGRGYTPAFARTAEEDDFPLEPETGINSQIGVRTFLSKGISMEGAVFYNDIQNTVVQLPFSINNADVYLNSADSRSYGVDLGLRFDSASYTDSAYNWFGQVAYNYTNAEFTEDGVDQNGNPVAIDGNEVPEISNHSASLTLGIEHTAGWHVSGTLTYLDSFFTDPSNRSDTVVADEDGELLTPGVDDVEIREPAVLGEVPSHTLISARALYTLPNMPNTTLWLQGRNLTDKLYITDFSNGLRPGAERTFIGGITVKF